MDFLELPEVDDHLCTLRTEVIDTIGAIIEDVGRRATCILEGKQSIGVLQRGQVKRCPSVWGYTVGLVLQRVVVEC